MLRLQTLWLIAVALIAPRRDEASAAPVTADGEALTGVWAGSVSVADATSPIAFEMAPDSSGAMRVWVSFPPVHFERFELGALPWSATTDSLRLGGLRFGYDREHGELRGTMPRSWTPGHVVPMVLRRGADAAMPARAALGGTVRAPRWSVELGSPAWPGPSYAAGVVYVGGDDGVLHAFDARTGVARWSFRAGGPIRTRATVDGGALYFQSDDGMLHRLAAADGHPVWSVKVADTALVRLPSSDPATRWDRFGSDVTVADGTLYLGTYQGRVLAIDPGDGHTRWSATTGGAVSAAPAVVGGRVYAGSDDHMLVALDTADGRRLWSRDLGGAVVSTPAVVDGRVVIGTRGYDLLGLDVTGGDTVWEHYLWMSWVESSPVVRDGVAYVGSSEAAVVTAVGVRDGRRRWAADVHGWAWGQPVVGATRVYMTVSGRAGVPLSYGGGVVALDRASGRVVWHYDSPRPASGEFGCPGSPAEGGGLVYASSLDGRLVALPE